MVTDFCGVCGGDDGKIGEVDADDVEVPTKLRSLV